MRRCLGWVGVAPPMSCISGGTNFQPNHSFLYLLLFVDCRIEGLGQASNVPLGLEDMEKGDLNADSAMKQIADEASSAAGEA